MTLDQLLSVARDTLAKRAILPARETDLANGIVNLLGESQPCGLERPEPFLFESDGRPGVGFGEDAMSSDEARAFAAMLLRAADAADLLAAEAAEEAAR